MPAMSTSNRCALALATSPMTLIRRPRRPVYEASLTYEPASGFVEVVAPDRESRAEIARIFSRELLSAEFKGELAVSAIRTASERLYAKSSRSRIFIGTL
jgi:CRP-like cAMP-binding protein